MQIHEFGIDQFRQLNHPEKDSHKAQNGRVLVIGGSKLFHASIFWSADIASRFVDLVHFSSPANENNEVVRTKLKQNFWDGIVVDWSEIDYYITEDDVIVIGPGMPREDGLMEGEEPTATIVNRLLAQFPDKKWVVDGGALQEVDPTLLNKNMIITPHRGEWQRILNKLDHSAKTENLDDLDIESVIQIVADVSSRLDGTTILLKGIDQKDLVITTDQALVIEGGNQGLTKGGTGDVLAGLVGSFWVMNQPDLSAAAASFLLKHGADHLAESMGIHYNTSDLVAHIPKAMKAFL